MDGQDISVNLTGLIGLTNYKITVCGVTVKDGPGVEVYLKTKEGSKLISLELADQWFIGSLHGQSSQVHRLIAAGVRWYVTVLVRLE